VALPCALIQPLYRRRHLMSPELSGEDAHGADAPSARCLSGAGCSSQEMHRCAPAKSQNANAVVVEGQDESIRISTAELEAERQRCQKLASDSQMDQESTRGPSGRPRRGLSCNRRRPRAGHYPMHFSPYRMTDKSIALEKGLIRNDLKVSLSRGGQCVTTRETPRQYHFQLIFSILAKQSMDISLRAHFESNYFAEECSFYDSEHEEDNKCKASGLGHDGSGSVEPLQSGEKDHHDKEQKRSAAAEAGIDESLRARLTWTERSVDTSAVFGRPASACCKAKGRARLRAARPRNKREEASQIKAALAASLLERVSSEPVSTLSCG
jgi:hypothetical protein